MTDLRTLLAPHTPPAGHTHIQPEELLRIAAASLTASDAPEGFPAQLCSVAARNGEFPCIRDEEVTLLVLGKNSSGPGLAEALLDLCQNPTPYPVPEGDPQPIAEEIQNAATTLPRGKSLSTLEGATFRAVDDDVLVCLEPRIVQVPREFAHSPEGAQVLAWWLLGVEAWRHSRAGN